ncbi:unnamed protein product [Oikopleura dioica]|uniref:RING-type domain-containing protein n=1 Tax=Oikopleura dioica TaxID=34765 RepID=E4Z2A6_OIKDI|nr:unnamed protein product [Oikopleura dioica]
MRASRIVLSVLKEFNMHSVLPSVITVCGHQLCDVCVDRCLRDFSRCPICSSPIFEGDVLRHYDLFQEKPKELPGCDLV